MVGLTRPSSFAPGDLFGRCHTFSAPPWRAPTSSDAVKSKGSPLFTFSSSPAPPMRAGLFARKLPAKLGGNVTTGDGLPRAAAALCRRIGLGARGTAGKLGENRPEALKKGGG